MPASSLPPPAIGGNMLDYYLDRGYYRMQQELFTCQFLPIAHVLRTVHWLRLRLEAVQYGPAQRRLLRLNAQFAISIRPFQLSAEYEALYARYRQGVSFDAPESIQSFLLGDETHNVFSTGVVEVRDEGKLIAAGIFDCGARTLAGIMNFYDPAYHRHSLGKYLMLLKIDFAQRQQCTFYYPGYLVQGYPKFDYKLFACRAATEVFDCVQQQWRPFSWEEVATQSNELLANWVPAGWNERQG